MKYVSAAISFIVVFAFAFILGGWFLMPYLPPKLDHSVTIFEAEYWTTNWAGALLGGNTWGVVSPFDSQKGREKRFLKPIA